MLCGEADGYLSVCSLCEKGSSSEGVEWKRSAGEDPAIPLPVFKRGQPALSGRLEDDEAGMVPGLESKPCQGNEDGKRVHQYIVYTKVNTLSFLFRCLFVY